MIFSPVQPFRDIRLIVTNKFCTVKVTDKIFSSTPSEVTSRIYIDNQCPFLIVDIAVYRKFHHIRTFKLTGLHTVSFAKATQVVPVFQIMGVIETHFLIGRDNHHPFTLRCIPEDFRVTEIFQTIGRTQNRILFVFSKCPSVVFAISQTLNLSVLIAGRSIVSEDGTCSVARHILLIDNRTTGKDMP